MISNCGLSFAYGMVASNFEWLAWIFMLLSAMFFLPYYSALKVSTMPEFILHRYGARSRNMLSWVIFFQISIGAGSVLFAGALLLSQISEWNIVSCIIICGFLAVIFTITGGLNAVALTDSFQGLLMIIVCSFLTVFGFREVGGWSDLWSNLPSDHGKLFRPASDHSYPWYSIVLGYPIMGVWYWCANQTIVQTALGGRTLKQGQQGILFSAYLKLLVPAIFLFPGILCAVLHPDIDPDDAFMTMVVNYLPHGLIGLVISALIAALISTVNSMYNSGSTIFTLDIYARYFNAQINDSQKARIGRITMVFLFLLSVGIALGQSAVEGLTLFEIVNSIFAFLSPSLAVVFLSGIFWKKATGKAAFYTLGYGNIPVVIIGLGYLANYPSRAFYPNFLLISFFLFCALLIFMVTCSFLTQSGEKKSGFPTLSQAYEKAGYQKNADKRIWMWWGVLGIIMIFLYVYFN